MAPSTSKSAPKSKKKYAVYSPADRADIGKYCLMNGPASTLKKFKNKFPALNESSARYMREKYKASITSKKRKHDFSEVTEIQSKKRGRPMLLGKELDDKVQGYVSVLRDSGAVINSSILIATAKAIVESQDSMLLEENGGPITIGKPWAKSMMNRLNLEKHKLCKTEKAENFEEMKIKFLSQIRDIVSEFNIPADLIINWNHSSLSLIPVSDWAMEEDGNQRVEISGLADKRKITAVFAGTMAGDFLPPQLIFGGKTDRCHPKHSFPEDWHITHSENQAANTETEFQYVDNIIVPYIRATQKRLSLPKTSKALCIFNKYGAQITEDFLDHLSKNDIKAVFVPANCITELQPMDLGVQKSVKSSLKELFETWYTSEVRKQLKDTNQVEPVEMPLQHMKEHLSKWLMLMFNRILSNPDLVISGFKAAGITDALEDKKIPLK